ncbi:MAG: hypothetical protein E7314_06325 [Clostridiales bacterium]|nr:hypothetical protein [Clostridiales bacterium]
MSLAIENMKFTNWWIAEENSLLAFVNVYSGRYKNKKLKIVGFVKNHLILAADIISSSSYIKTVTTREIILEDGTSYPIKEAHTMYLKFLVEANSSNSVIATNLKFDNHENKATADIFNGETWIKDVVFDFVEKNTSDMIKIGYSQKMCTAVVLTPFSGEHISDVSQISRLVYANLYNATFVLEDNAKHKLIMQAREALKKKK